MSTSPAITIRVAQSRDAAVLASIGARTFSETFGAENTPDDLAHYLAASFGEVIQRGELEETRHVVFLAEHEGEVAGYAMLREGPAPACVQDRDVIEIARLYAMKRYIGSGVGAALMQCCLDEAVRRGRSTLWLGVWEHNARAISFYQRWAFQKVGVKPFILGGDWQTDHVLARTVER